MSANCIFNPKLGCVNPPTDAAGTCAGCRQNPMSPVNNIISDKEWEQFIQEECRQVSAGLPKRDHVEMFLRWKEKNNAGS